MIKREMNILEEIKKINGILQNVKDLAEDKEIINEAINELYVIIEDNKDEKDFKNIGIKVNKFNIKKYINAKEHFENFKNVFPKIKIDGKSVNAVLFKSIQTVESYKEIQENIEHRINNYQVALEKNLKN